MTEVSSELIIQRLNKILELELAGVVRYTHYSLMVFGYNRIPIVKWLRDEAQESLNHAHRAGELITYLGGHPSLGIGPLLETHKHNIRDILTESLEHEKAAIEEYRALFHLTEDKALLFEDYAREMISIEEMHIGDVMKMLRNPDKA